MKQPIDQWHQSHQPAQSAPLPTRTTAAIAARNRAADKMAAALGRAPRYLTAAGNLTERATS